ncbi:MAG: DUF5986 family protein [Lachnospiraceae bacterium]
MIYSRKIVYCIEKAIGDDLQQYLRENHRETNNAIILLRGDNINTNLRTHVVKDDIRSCSFPEAWLVWKNGH